MERQNLWAPWRIKYIQGLAASSGCFLCQALASPEKDRENLVLWRTEHALVMFNRYPYSNGHLLVAPVKHVAGLSELSEAQMLSLTRLTRDSQRALELAIKPHGFNVGMNFGRCAGAGLPEHMHIHVVPRWSGDTSFMPICSDTNVISQGLYELYDQLAEVSQKENLPQT
ncbi:MAG: HIT domain-containing protein [Planctomycetaceae bacterium]|nr:HIT domain-containing protein [Planctomycetaceae bacterium]